MRLRRRCHAIAPQTYRRRDRSHWHSGCFAEAMEINDSHPIPSQRLGGPALLDDAPGSELRRVSPSAGSAGAEARPFAVAALGYAPSTMSTRPPLFTATAATE